MHLKKIRYYPTPEQAKTLVEENILVNFQRDTLYDIPYVYPCDKNSHFDLEMMNVLVLQDQPSYNQLVELMTEWDGSTMAEFKEFFKLYKGRTFDE